MNPFDLHGPAFLFAYLILAVVTCVILYRLRRASESGPLPSIQFKDPYLFAFLQAGAREALGAGTISLIDRGLLKAQEGIISQTGLTSQFPIVEIEREVLHHFRNPDSFEGLLRAIKDGAACRGYEQQLRSYKLLPDAAIQSGRNKRLFVAMLVLVGVAVTKLIIALSQGRRNIWFLIILSFIAVVVASNVGNPYRTSLGTAYLESTRKLFAHMRDNSAALQSGASTPELLWLVALFGVGAVPQSVFPFMSDFVSRSSGDSGGGGCGGGCGGGGCGGGCGG